MDSVDTLEKDERVEETKTEEKQAPKTALAFEIAEDDEGFVFDSEADITPELVKNEPVAEQAIEEDEIKEEFSVPETFEVNQKYASTSFIEDPIRIRTTYVPRFTEVSENYRMADDPRPRAVPRTQVVTKEEKTVEQESLAPLDPTSEIHETKDVEKVIVTSAHSGIEEPTDESITLYKFNMPVTEENSKEAAEEQEPVIEIPVAEDVEESVMEEPSVSEEPAVAKTNEEYRMPDPVDSVRVIEYSDESGVSDADAPAGLCDVAKSNGKAEFTTPNQREYFKDRFLDIIMSVKVRIVAALLVLIAMSIMDVAGFFGMNIYKNFGLAVVPSAKAIIDLQFVTCLLLFAIPEVIKAVKSLIAKTVVPEVTLVVSYLVIVIYTLVICFTDAIDYPSYAILFGVQVLTVIFGSYFKLSADFSAFRLISKNGAKNVVDKKLTRDLPKENMALDGAVDEYRSNTARMFRTNFVSGFYSRTAKVNENGFNVVLMLCVGLGTALVSGLVSFFLNGNSLVSFAVTMTLVFFLSYPCFSILSHKMAYKHANREADSESSTFVGENSLLEYSDVDVIAYEDTEIFGVEDVSIKKVHLYGKAFNTPKAMKQMYSLFAVVGGPLDHVFSSSLDRKGDVATDVVIEPDGISGLVDGHRVFAGTEEYMIRNNVSIPSDDYRTKLSSTDSTKVMYGAEDGEVYVKFFIRYSFSEEFTMLLPHLKQQNIVPLIYTRDPNITGELLRVLTSGEDLIRVMKKNVAKTTEDRIYPRLNVGLATLGSKSCAVNMILLAKKYVSFQKNLAVTEIVAMVTGAFIALAFALTGSITMPIALLGCLQLAWCLYLYVRSRCIFRIRKSKGNQ